LPEKTPFGLDPAGFIAACLFRQDKTGLTDPLES